MAVEVAKATASFVVSVPHIEVTKATVSFVATDKPIPQPVRRRRLVAAG